MGGYAIFIPRSNALYEFRGAYAFFIPRSNVLNVYIYIENVFLRPKAYTIRD